METFSALLAICAGNSPVSGVNSPHKGQWRGTLMFSLICTWINGWVNNGEAGDLRRYRAHSDVTIMVHKNCDGNHAHRGLMGYHLFARCQWWTAAWIGFLQGDMLSVRLYIVNMIDTYKTHVLILAVHNEYIQCIHSIYNSQCVTFHVWWYFQYCTIDAELRGGPVVS